MTRSPLLGARRAGEALALEADARAITVARFLADVTAVAARLPDAGHVLNDCADRYRFLVGFAAALVRGQVSLLPSNRVAHLWAQLRRDYPDAYCLTDQTEVPDVLPVHRCEPPPAGAAGAAEIPTFAHDRVAAIAFTSGSTGDPKPIVKHWGALVGEAQVGGRRLGLDAAPAACLVATVPPQHMYGFTTSIMLPLQFDCACHRERPFFAEDIRATLENCPRPAVLVTTPAQLRACVLERSALPPLRFILSSAAPLPAALAREAETLFRTPVLEYYGSTETGAIASRRQTESEWWRTFDTVRVRAQTAGFEVDAPYFHAPVALGDSVEIRNPESFLLLGRNADMIKIGGKRASLMHLNQVLLEIDGVVDGTFFLPDGAHAAASGELRLTAFVVAPGRDADEILAALRARIDAVFLPRPLRLVPALPRTASGKLPRESLKRLLEESGGCQAERIAG